MPFLWWVLDANILYAVVGGDLNAGEFIFELRKWRGIALDDKHAIVNQYRPALQQSELLAAWFEELTSKSGKFYFFPSNVPSRHRRNLIDSLRFHDDDLVYVGVAYHTPHKLIVSEDRGPGDFDHAVCEYLQENLRVSVLCTTEACEKAASSAAG